MVSVPEGALHVDIEGKEHILYNVDGEVILHRYGKKKVLVKFINTKAGWLKAEAYMGGFVRGQKQGSLD